MSTKENLLKWIEELSKKSSLKLFNKIADELDKGIFPRYGMGEKYWRLKNTTDDVPKVEIISIFNTEWVTMKVYKEFRDENFQENFKTMGEAIEYLKGCEFDGLDEPVFEEKK